MNQPEYNQYRIDAQTDNAKPCACEKTTCMIGMASIAIGIGGLIIASLL